MNAVLDINLILGADYATIQHRAANSSVDYVSEFALLALTLDDLRAANLIAASPAFQPARLADFAQRKVQSADLSPRAVLWLSVATAVTMPGLREAIRRCLHDPDQQPVLAQARKLGLYPQEWLGEDIAHAFSLGADQYRNAQQSLLSLPGAALQAVVAATEAGNDAVAAKAALRISDGTPTEALRAALAHPGLGPAARTARSCRTRSSWASTT